MPLSDFQADFAAATLDPGRAVPDGLVGPDGHAAPRRFGVYRNNVVVGLVKALEAGFPAILRLVGEEFFRAMARAYVLAEPPRSPLMILYGASFPDFVASFPPLAAHPYMGDVARIEYAWRLAFHAADARPIDPAALAALPPQTLGDVVFTLHPSLHIVRSAFPALSIFAANREEGEDRPVDLAAGGEDAMILRAHAHVEASSLPPGGAAFLGALAGGAALAAAAKAAFGETQAFDLARNLQGLLAAGAVVGLGPGDPAPKGA